MKRWTSGLAVVVWWAVALIFIARTGSAEVVDTQMLLQPPNPHLNQAFGYAVAVSGTNAVVGAPESALAIGGACVYSKFGTNWNFQQQLIPTQALTNDLVGVAVAINNDLIAIGAPGFNTNSSTASFGSVYIYQQTNGVWTEQARLTAPDRQRADNFGVSVAFSGQSVVIGSSFHNDLGATNNGAVYVFDLTAAGWQLSGKLLPSDLTNNCFFGGRVAISGDTLIAGANNSIVEIGNALFIAPGAAYIYRRGNVTPLVGPWSLQQKLLPNDFNDSGQFGFSLAIDQDTALVGAPFTGDGGTVYSFVRNGNIWTNQTQLVPSDRTNGDAFGFSVALQGTRAVIGAVGKSSNNVAGVGAAYVFTQTNVFISTNTIFATNTALVQTNTFSTTNAFASTNTLTPPSPTFLAQSNLFVGSDVFAANNVLATTNGLEFTNGLSATNALTNNGWIEQQELLAPQVSDNFQFGFSVGIGTQGILVGTPAAPTERGTGAAYMFGSSESLLSIVSATATPSLLLAGLRTMVPVTINVVTTGSNVTSKIVSISSNQADVGTGMNADAPDAIITGNLTALLRAELTDDLNVDRVYNLLIESMDRFGNIATTTVSVVVPHTVGTPPTQSTFGSRQFFSARGLINSFTPGASPFTVNLATP